jgi:hypothetical protein
MSRLLIGSSNVYRHYRAVAYSKYTEYSMVRCVEIESFVSQMENLEPTETEVVISVIENFISKAADTKPAEGRNVAIFECIKSYLVAVEDAARKYPGSKFILIDPILRPKLSWYDAVLDTVRKEIKDGVESMGLVNVSRLDIISRASQLFDPDGVHLTKSAGAIFIESILAAAEKSFAAPFINLESDDAQDHHDDHDQDAPSIEHRVAKLEFDTEERKWNDNLLFARTREELDMAANKTKEDRIVITGLTTKVPPPADRDQKKAWLRKLVIDTITLVKPDFDGNVGFINQGKSNGKEIPMVEVRLGSVEVATAVRKAYAEKRKEGDGSSMGKLYMSNSVTLSTRVRIDILKSISKKISNDKESGYVAAYSSRPILHVRTKTGKGEEVVNRAYTFTDAIIRFGQILNKQDLDDAYKRAGTAFRGQLEQHFVVLRDWKRFTSGPSGSGASGRSGLGGSRSGKRPRQPSPSSQPPKSKKK